MTSLVLCCFLQLEYYSPINTVKLITSWSVNLLILYLGRLFSKWLTSTYAYTFSTGNKFCISMAMIKRWLQTIKQCILDRAPYKKECRQIVTSILFGQYLKCHFNPALQGEKMNLLTYAPNKYSNQPVYLHHLSRVFIVCRKKLCISL